MNVRRRVSELERPITSGANVGRKWYGYSPYSAQIVNKLLHIFRAYYNYCRVGESGHTPAERIGLAKGPVSTTDIIYGKRFGGYTFAKKAQQIKQEKYEKAKRWRESKQSTKAQRRRARFFLRTTNPTHVVFLSALTDGVAPDRKVVEVAIANEQGKILLDLAVNPGRPVCQDTVQKHGLKDAMLSGKPTMSQLERTLLMLLEGAVVVTFDLPFDVTLFPERVVECVQRVETYMDLQRTLLKWTASLENAASAIDFKWPKQRNRAMAQALALRAVWNHLAGWTDDPEPEEASQPSDGKKKPKKRKTTEPAPLKSMPAEGEPAPSVDAPPVQDHPPPAPTQVEAVPTEPPANEPQSDPVPPEPVLTQRPHAAARAGTKRVRAHLPPAPVQDELVSTAPPAARPPPTKASPDEAGVQPTPAAASADVRPAPETVYLDTETTGLKPTDQIVEMAIVDDNGNTLLNERIRPTCRISAGAFRVHGISADMLASSPTLAELEAKIIEAVRGRHVVIFNKRFDEGFLTDNILAAMASSSCCRQAFLGIYRKNRKGPRAVVGTTSLAHAADSVGYRAHSALGDALACRAVWRHVRNHAPKSGGIASLRDIY